ncbi:toll-like receptor 4 isoform X2 [Contarinia nasturtii]|uniref:toll-like receptor 4 isoform X2 n=1 Tax=Contarinia nasturtii TaxID=265458 RepID=UPI0012D4837C|nr:toll-like receptor 4 isoform X2 [Contarinia nasturtii]
MNIAVVAFVSLVYATSFIDGTYGSGMAMPTATDKNLLKKEYCEPGAAYKLFGYDCSDMGLVDVPQNLRSSVKILDLSINRIRELKKTSFKRYSDIKLLYLFDNKIKNIEEGTFAHLTNLEAIDLSSNTLVTISIELFELPRLRNLYYSDNPLSQDRIEADLKHLEKPIAAPLQKLFMAECSLTSILDFGILPDLVHLNISFNVLNEITPQQFSPFCNLRTVTIQNSTKLNPCTCKSLQAYFDRRLIFLNHTFDCQTPHEEVYCSESVNATVDSDEYNKCLVRVEEKIREEKSREMWLRISIGLGVFFAIFIFVLYYFHRRNAQRTKQLEKQSTKLRHIHQTQNGNVEVLLTK